jgi:hypothetical protein
MRRLRALAANLALLACTLAFCALLLEGGVRLFLRDRIVLYPRFHDPVTYGPFTIRRLLPHATFWHRSIDGSWQFRINSRGFRSDREYTYAKPPGTYRVLCLGDSQTQGFECHQDRTYSQVLERTLAASGRRVEVINAGVSGFGTAESLVFLEQEGLRYQPDAVVLGFFVNDPDDNLKSGLFKLEGGELTVARHEHIPAASVLARVHRSPVLRWLSQNSYAYSHLFNTVWDLRKQALLTRSQREASAELSTTAADADEALARHRDELAAALLARMHASCRARGVPLLVLDIPAVSTNASGFASSFSPALASAAETHSDVFLPVGATLGGITNADSLFVPHGQRHVSESTHRILGEACARALNALPR